MNSGAVVSRATEPVKPGNSNRTRAILRGLVPVLVAVAIALLPVPTNLKANAWYYFALFIGVIVGLMLEPIPPAAIGLVGVVAAGVLGLVEPKPSDAIRWALSGFSNSSVWLIFAAFMFSLGYEKTGLGRRVGLQSRETGLQR